MATLLIVEFGETDSRDKAIGRLVKVWGEGVIGSSPGFLQIAITDVCKDTNKALELCRLYGGKLPKKS